MKQAEDTVGETSLQDMRKAVLASSTLDHLSTSLITPYDDNDASKHRHEQHQTAEEEEEVDSLMPVLDWLLWLTPLNAMLGRSKSVNTCMVIISCFLIACYLFGTICNVIRLWPALKYSQLIL